MRPVRRNKSPQNNDFNDYKEAKPFLVNRLGRYCSYCERPILTQLAVEHIQPKGLSSYAHLIGRWDNYLLACVNCNATKKDKDVVLSEVLLPDRDNTFAAYRYSADGRIAVQSGLHGAARAAAKKTLNLVGLDKPSAKISDENVKLVAIDRVSQRMEAWMLAKRTKRLLVSNPDSQALRRCAVCLAKENGFFSIWMTVFDSDVDMKRSLVAAFEGTSESGCFDTVTMTPVSPAPNPDALPHGGKV